ncbi:hypothetical protein PLESTF_001425100 [Pleodorina starrii]|nr:hypothetical protein PLESTM_000549300 [Pleodorina starrii]GLC73826.1 hypothetical protein PLESTF_001425100 [Pleodorina starrii]
MPTAVAQILNLEREPSASPNGAVAGRRSGFKLPAPLNTSDELLDRNVWSPSRRNSSIVNGELRTSNSPRTMAGPAGSLLATQPSGGSSLSSPKPATPTRFEDPLLAMPSFRRSAGSPTVDPTAPAFVSASASGGAASTSATGGAATPPLLPSPSFLGPGPSASNSFSARRSNIDFRRSVPGTSPSSAAAITSPGEALAPVSGGRSGAAAGSRFPGLVRGTSDSGSLDLPPYASSLAGSESGGPGLDDGDEGAADQEVDSAAAAGAQLRMGLAADAASAAAGASGAGLPGRRHSAFAVHSPSVSCGSFNPNGSQYAAAARPGGISPAARILMQRQRQQQQQQQPASEEEEFMARLQANRSSWRERSRSSSHTAAGHPHSIGAGAAGTAAVAAPHCESGLQNQTHAALEQLRCELKSLSMRSMHGSPAAAAAAAAAAAPPSGPSSAGAAAGGGGVFGSTSGPALARLSEGQASWTSPARLSFSQQHHSSSGAASGSVGGFGGGAAPELLPRRLASSPQTETESPRAQAATQAF